MTGSSARSGDGRLHIRAAQYEVLAASARRDLVRTIAARLRGAPGARAAALSDQDLSDLAAAAIDTAPRYGIHARRDLVRWAEYLLILGREFDTDPALAWIAAILRNPRYDGAEKVLWIDDGLEARA